MNAENPSELVQKGIALHRAGNTRKAEQFYRQALDLDPNHADAHNNLGNALFDLGRFEDATKSYAQAIALNPEFADAHNNLGNALMRMGRLGDAAISFRHALDIDPDDALAHYNLGTALQERGRFEDAAVCHRKAITLNPQFIEAHNNLGTALQKLGRLEDAALSYQNVLALKPDFGDALNNLGTVFQKLGRLDEAATIYRDALAANPDNVEAGRNLLYLALNTPGLSVEEIFAEHLRFSETHGRGIKANQENFANGPDPDRRLKIGYLSSDFRDHAVGSALLPVLSSHDRAAFEVFCYADIPRPDAVTEKFRDCADHWRPTVNKTDARIADMIRADGIDVLVSVAGHFDNNRPLVCAHRPAPVQVSFHDGATSGLAEMDYWLTDGFLHPPGTQEIFTEELFHLPVFYQWPPIAEAPPVGPLPAEKADFVTFASFNNPAKLNDDVIGLWAEILQSVPGSRLMLKFKNIYSQPSLCDRVSAKFKAHGIDAERIEMVSSLDTITEHLGHYAKVDIALDPFPFNGATTTYQTLWMGVPVISLAGETFISRAAGSILHHAGLDELIAETPEDYVAAARDLAADIPRLIELRAGLRDKVASSPLCAAPAYARNVEAAFREMWRWWCGKPN